jgi:type I restriction enzyme S subunit
MMSNNQNIPSGYKPSPLGPIPEDWEVKRLGEVCNKITDGTHGTPQKQQRGVPYLTAIHIKDGVIDYDNCYYLAEEDHREIYQRCNPEYGDVLMVNIGAGVGTVAMNKVEYEFSLKNVALLKPNKRILTGYFLETYLLSSKKKNLHKLINGGAQPFWGLDDIAKIHILLPSLAEQSKFENVIRLWDTTIEKQTQLVEKLTMRKHGLMQQLLTGKKRLKGFSGELQSVKLGEILEERFELVGNRSIEPVSVGVMGIRLRSEVFDKELSADYSRNKVLSKHQICFGLGTNQIVFDVLLSDNIYCVSPAYRIYSIKQCNPVFFKAQLSVYTTFLSKKHLIISARQGKSVDFNGLLSERLMVPSESEQNAIASVLVNADKEIEIQKTKLTAMQAQKKGLMQVLLTGKKRIKKLEK